MLADTLVVWTTEFGRTPGVDGTKDRGHHSACFSSWLAGAGVKSGIIHGATDEIASTVAENKSMGTISTRRSCTCSGSSMSASLSGTAGATTG